MDCLEANPMSPVCVRGWLVFRELKLLPLSSREPARLNLVCLVSERVGEGEGEGAEEALDMEVGVLRGERDRENRDTERVVS